MYSAARARNMTSGSILGHLTAFSLPLMIENLFQLLYNTADTIIVGRCIDKSALAAVGATSMVIWLVTAVFMGFSTGVTTMAARCYGAREYDEFRRIARNAFGAIPLVGIALMIPSMLLVPQVLDVINTPADIYVVAEQYLRSYLFAMPAIAVFNIGSGILRAVGDSKRPVAILMATSVLNIVLDYVFIRYCNMGVAGAAWASVAAHYVSAAVVVIMFARTHEVYRCSPRDYTLQASELKRIGYFSFPQVLERTVTYLSNVFVQGYINYFGSSFIAAYSACSKVDSFLFMVMTSISAAELTFAGQNAGAKQYARIKKSVRVAVAMALSLLAVLSAAILLNRETIISIFNDDPEVISYGVMIMGFMVPFEAITCIYSIYGSLFKGVGDVVSVTVMWLGSFVLCRQVYLYIAANFICNEPLMIIGSMPLGWGVCSLISLVYYFSGRWKRFLGLRPADALEDA